MITGVRFSFGRSFYAERERENGVELIEGKGKCGRVSFFVTHLGLLGWFVVVMKVVCGRGECTLSLECRLINYGNFDLLWVQCFVCLCKRY